MTLLLSAHLLAVNVAAAGPVVGAWLDWRGVRGEALAATGAVFVARASLHALLTGAVLGLAIGWLKWDEPYRELWTGPLSYKLRWALLEVGFSLVLMVIWWWWLPGKAGGGKAAAVGRVLVAVLAATNLLYHFPALFSVAARLHAAENLPGAVLRGESFRTLMLSAETPALAVHVSLASLAVAGLVVVWFAVRGREAELAEEQTRLARAGGWWALLATVAQLPVGLWTLMTLGPTAQSAVMGSDTFGTLLLVGSLASALWLINDLVQLTLGEPSRALARRATLAMLVTVVLMTGMQQRTVLRKSGGESYTSATTW